MGCGGTAGSGLAGVDVDRQAVIEGVVLRADEPVAGAYVRLLDPRGEFVAEVPTDEEGSFRFFAASGQWTVRTLAPRAAPVEEPVTAATGRVARVTVTL